MSNYSDTQKQTERYLQLWVYFLPVVGFIPAIWTLYRAKDKAIADSQKNPLENYCELRQQLKASRLSVNLTLIWLCSYILFSSGAASGTEIISFRFLYANAITTTGYFVACTFFMSRLGKKRLFSTD